MAKSRRRSSVVPSFGKVVNGTYIDFEGFGRKSNGTTPPPVVLGFYRKTGEGEFDAGFKQVVFTEDFRRAAEDSDVAHRVEYQPNREQFLLDLLESTGTAAPLFGFSEHDLRVFERVCGQRPERRYFNVRAMAKRWRRVSGQGSGGDGENTLESVCDAMGIPLPGKLGKNGVTDRLRVVSSYSSLSGTWRLAPDSARQAWREVLLHNYDDVRAIYEIMRRLRPGPEAVESEAADL